MKIPTAFSKMKDAFHRAAQAMEDMACDVDTRREQLHEAGVHLQNAGRALSGKEAKEAEPLAGDKGILAKVRNTLSGMGRAFSAMERRTGTLAEKMQDTRQEQKPSVKSELHVLKSEQAAKKKAPVLTEQAR